MDKALQEELRLIGKSLIHAAEAGDLAAVAKWAAKATALTAAKPVEPKPDPKPEPKPEPVPGDATPGDAPTGLTNWAAASADAGFVFQASLGNLVGADTNPAPGAAEALGFSGVVGSGDVYGTFIDGELVETGPNPGAGPGGFSTPFSLLRGIDKDGPYTGPGAVRP